MHISLINDPSRINRLDDHIPPLSDAPENSYERFELPFDPFDYFDLIDNDFIQPVNIACRSLLDVGDVDCLDTAQCQLLVPWLKEKVKQAPPHPLDTFYPKLLELANKAIERETGVVIDL